MGSQVIETESGERLVVIPEREYEALLDRIDNAASEAAYDRIKEKLAAGEEEMLPAAMVYRLLDGENPVSVWREHRGLALADLAAKAGLDPDGLARVEAGEEPSIGTTKAIADALGGGLDDLYA